MKTKKAPKNQLVTESKNQSKKRLARARVEQDLAHLEAEGIEPSELELAELAAVDVPEAPPEPQNPGVVFTGNEKGFPWRESEPRVWDAETGDPKLVATVTVTGNGKKYVAYLNGERLVGETGGTRFFGTPLSAMAAAEDQVEAPMTSKLKTLGERVAPTLVDVKGAKPGRSMQLVKEPRTPREPRERRAAEPVEFCSVMVGKGDKRHQCRSNGGQGPGGQYCGGHAKGVAAGMTFELVSGAKQEVAA